MKHDDKISEQAETVILAKQVLLEVLLASNTSRSTSSTTSNPHNSNNKDYTRSITSMLASTRKNSSHAYVSAIKRRTLDEDSWRQDRLIKAIRKKYSADHVKDILREMASVTRFERVAFMDRMEQLLGLSRPR